jgi:hypothetical protein
VKTETTTELKIEDVKSDGRYIVKVLCSECGKVLLDSVPLIGSELKEAWSNLVLTKGFNTPPCREGCRPTFSDFNINSQMTIEELANAD